MSDEKLGFTFYPKDWWTSDTFFILNPIERYIFLEMVFMMYSAGGSISNNKTIIERRLSTKIDDDVWAKITDLMVQDGKQLTMLSVNKRLRKTVANQQNGLKGGRPKSPKKEDDEKPKKPNLETHENPPLEIKENRIEKETLLEVVKENPTPTIPEKEIIITALSIQSDKDNANHAYQDSNFHALCYNKGIKNKEEVFRIMSGFLMHRAGNGFAPSNSKDFRQHFINWIMKGGHLHISTQITTITNEQPPHIPKADKAAIEAKYGRRG